MLVARLFESLPLVCPNGGADLRIIAFITQAAPVRRILAHIGEHTEPPPIAPARGPLAWEDAPEPTRALPGRRRLSLPETVQPLSSPRGALRRRCTPHSIQKRARS